MTIDFGRRTRGFCPPFRFSFWRVCVSQPEPRYSGRGCNGPAGPLVVTGLLLLKATGRVEGYCKRKNPEETLSFTGVILKVETRGVEPLTPCLQSRCSPN